MRVRSFTERMVYRLRLNFRRGEVVVERETSKVSVDETPVAKPKPMDIEQGQEEPPSYETAIEM